MNSSRNFWPMGIALAFVLFIGGTAGLVVLAATQKTELVSVNYYEQELKYQNRIESLDRARHLGGEAGVVYDPASRQISIRLPAVQAGEALAGSIQLYRPSAAGMDRQFPLAPESNGIQRIDASNLPKGLWKVRVSWIADKKEYFLDQKIFVGVPPAGSRQ